ncbi:hypothetical protein FGB62_8g25 [Gracilaria domingensis]|nr:hypothetical protein FGB62_8g25 [Gracilaria domingensis]
MTFRPKSGSRHYAETPCDRFSWYTASSAIQNSKLLEDEPYDASAVIVQCQYRNTGDNSFARIRTLESSTSKMNYGRVKGEQNLSVPKSLFFSRGILSSEAETNGSTAYQFRLERSELISEIVARAAYDTDLAMQENSQNQRKLRDISISNETMKEVVHGVLQGREYEFDVGIGHENDRGLYIQCRREKQTKRVCPGGPT